MFLTHLDARALIDRPGYWLVIAPLVWDDGQHQITVPVMFETDLASIPRPFRNVFSINGRSRRPAVLHDWLYCLKTGSRADADDLFLEAMKAEGVGFVTRWLMYTGVRTGGWLYWGRRDGLELDDFA